MSDAVREPVPADAAVAPRSHSASQTPKRPRGRPLGSPDRRGRAIRTDLLQRTSPRWRVLCRDSGDRLRQLREEQDVSAAELAAAIGISVQTVLRYERGHMPSWPVALAISIALGCSLVDLLPSRAHHP